MPTRAGKLAAEWLRNKGVRIILNDRITDWGGSCDDNKVPQRSTKGDEWKLITQNGLELRATLVYRCLGGQPCTGILKQVVQGIGGATVEIQDTLQVYLYKSNNLTCLMIKLECTI